MAWTTPPEFRPLLNVHLRVAHVQAEVENRSSAPVVARLRGPDGCTLVRHVLRGHERTTLVATTFSPIGYQVDAIPYIEPAPPRVGLCRFEMRRPDPDIDPWEDD